MTWDLRLGDCLDPVTGLASLPGKSVDVVITDPPYGQAIYDTYKNVGKSEKERRFNRDGDFRYMSGWEGIDPYVAPLCAQFERVARRWVVVFSDEEAAFLWRSAMGEWFIRFGAWMRQPVSLTPCQPARGFEAITVGHPRGINRRWNGGQNRAAVYFDRNLTGGAAALERHGHPCPKPVSLMEALVRDFTDPGELILDPFGGSGTTGVAAIRLGRRFIGWERDPKYHAVATKRLAGTREQTDLFRPKAPKAKQGVLL